MSNETPHDAVDPVFGYTPDVESRRIPKYRKIMATIRERIERGTYTPGKAIPSERSLAREFGTNSETVNKAIANLVAEGGLYRRQGIGTFVTDGGRADEQASAPGRTGRIDILTPKRMEMLFQASSFHEEVMFSIQTRLAARGYSSQIVSVPDLRDPVRHLAGIDAVIASTFLPFRLLNAIMERRMPLICLDFEHIAPRTRCLTVENSGIDQIIDHLIGLGHHDIAFVQSTEVNLIHERRRMRYLQYMALAELTVNMNRVFSVDPDNAETFGRFVQAIREVTALVVADDLLAVRVRAALDRLGLLVPQKISLTGYGNLSIAKKIYPDLTTSDVDRDRFCDRVLSEMSELINGAEQSEMIHFKTNLIVRGSTRIRID